MDKSILSQDQDVLENDEMEPDQGDRLGGKAPIQSVARCFDVLQALNAMNGANVRAIAETTGLARGTVYRFLEALASLGYARKDPHTTGYWLESKTRDLGRGFSNQIWILETAKQEIAALKAETQHYYYLSIPNALHMQIRLTTKVRKRAGGMRTLAAEFSPVGHSVAGHAYLANCADEERRRVLDGIYSGQASADIHGFKVSNYLVERAHAERHLELIKRNGYTTTEEKYGVRVISVPIIGKDTAIGALSVEYFRSALNKNEFRTHILRLRRSAEVIGAAY